MSQLIVVFQDPWYCDMDDFKTMIRTSSYFFSFTNSIHLKNIDTPLFICLPASKEAYNLILLPQ